MEFSCLLSCFYKDSPKYLKECFESLVCQTLKANEIVFVEDGKLTKELYDIIDSYSELLPLKRIALEKNKGLGNALNKGLLQCSNDIVIRMDTDDICYKSRFEKIISTMKENPQIDIIGSWAHDIDDNSSIISERKMPISHDEINKLIWTCPFIHPTVAFKKESILSVGSYNDKIKRRQDYELWFKAAHKKLNFANIPEFLLKYRFTDSYYKKNNLSVAIQQSKMGINGLVKLKSFSLFACLGVVSPVIRALLPSFVAKKTHALLSLIDPRKI